MSTARENAVVSSSVGSSPVTSCIKARSSRTSIEPEPSASYLANDCLRTAASWCDAALMVLSAAHFLYAANLL